MDDLEQRLTNLERLHDRLTSRFEKLVDHLNEVEARLERKIADEVGYMESKLDQRIDDLDTKVERGY